MRILQINNCHYRRGGADIVYLNTIKLMTTHGHDVIAFSKHSQQDENSINELHFIKNINYWDLSIFDKIRKIPRFLYSFEAAKNLSLLLNHNKPDIAHVHLYKGDLTPSIIKILNLHHIPIVLTLHDFGLLCPRNLFLNGENKICERCIKKHPINCTIYRCNRKSLPLSFVSTLEFIFNKTFFNPGKCFDKIITVSQFSFNKHIENLTYPEKFVLLYNFFPKNDHKDFKFYKGDYYLFYGRISQEKGLYTLIKSWIARKRKSRLKIVGDGPMFNEISMFLKTIDCETIDLLGYKTGSELDNLILNSSFVLVPSECYENNPMSIVESYSMGKPVIASSIGGITEIINEGHTGFLFEMANISSLDNIFSLTENISNYSYEILCQNCINFAQMNFSEKEHYNKLIQIYISAINHEK